MAETDLYGSDESLFFLFLLFLFALTYFFSKVDDGIIWK